MDALFVRVPNLKDNDFVRLWGVVTPDSILSLGSHLDSVGVECGLLDVYADPELAGIPTPAEMPRRLDDIAALVVDEVRHGRPRLLGFTGLSTIEAGVAVQVAQRVRAAVPQLPIVMGGYFPTNNADEILRDCSWIDGVVSGEGEVATAQVVARIREGRDPFAASIPNLCYRDGSTTVRTAPGPLIDLQKASAMNFELLRSPEEYRTLAYHTSRGCPWRCGYCLEATMGAPYRIKSLETVRRDLEAFQQRNRDFFLLLTDPMLAVSDKRLWDLTEVFSALGVRYLFETRVDVLRPSMVPRLEASGCRSIFFGFESASFETLLRMNKLRPADFNQYEKYLQGAIDLVEACAKGGVTPMLGVMVGYPGDTQEDLLFTFDFLRKLRSLYYKNVRSDARAGFVVSPSEVYMLRSTAIWKAQGFFKKKGLTTSEVRNASNYLSEKEIQMFYKTFNDLSVPPSTTSEIESPRKKSPMAATLEAQVKSQTRDGLAGFRS
jgi:radical SAM superfamily enzyme YgiQ (UPF0313 family)